MLQSSHHAELLSHGHDDKQRSLLPDDADQDPDFSQTTLHSTYYETISGQYEAQQPGISPPQALGHNLQPGPLSSPPHTDHRGNPSVVPSLEEFAAGLDALPLYPALDVQPNGQGSPHWTSASSISEEEEKLPSLVPMKDQTNPNINKFNQCYLAFARQGQPLHLGSRAASLPPRLAGLSVGEADTMPDNIPLAVSHIQQAAYTEKTSCDGSRPRIKPKHSSGLCCGHKRRQHEAQLDLRDERRRRRVQQTEGPIWQYQSSANWQTYNESISRQLELAFLGGEDTATVAGFTTDFINMSQTNNSAQHWKIRRFNSTTEMSLQLKNEELLQEIWFAQQRHSELPDGIQLGEHLTKYELYHSGALAVDDLANQHFARASSQFFQMMLGVKGAQAGLNIYQVDYYHNRHLLGAYERKRQLLHEARHPTNDIWVFHGTKGHTVDTIMKEGFKVGGQDHTVPVINGSAYGYGIYTATGPCTPMVYAERQGTFMLILAKALPGCVGHDADDIIDVDNDRQVLCHSWQPKADWHIFRQSDQVLPVYVVHYSYTI